MLYTIGQTPVRKSDKQRLAIRTDADTRGWRREILCHDASDYVTALPRKMERG